MGRATGGLRGTASVSGSARGRAVGRRGVTYSNYRDELTPKARVEGD